MREELEMQNLVIYAKVVEEVYFVRFVDVRTIEVFCDIIHVVLWLQNSRESDTLYIRAGYVLIMNEEVLICLVYLAGYMPKEKK